MNDSDLFFVYTNKNNRTGENHLNSSISNHKRPKTIAKSALLRIQNLHLPLISTATGSPLDSLSLQPDRPYTIGRTNSSCDFIFNSRLVSKQHCQILFDSFERKLYIIDGTFLLPDFSCIVNEFRRKRLLSNGKLLEEEEEEEDGIEGFSRVRVSLNGVFVNGVRVKKGKVKELNAGDEVLLVCGNEGVCRVRVQIGFLVLGVVFKEEVVFKSNEIVLERPHLLGTVASSGQTQGSVSSGKRSKRVFALQSNDVRNLDCNFSRLKYCNAIGRANFLSSQCRSILNSNDPISCIRQSPISDCGMEGSYGCNTKFPVLMISNKCKSSVGCDLKVKIVEPISGQEQIPCDTRAGSIQSGSITFHSEKVVASDAGHEQMDLCIHGDHLGHKNSIRTRSKNAVAGDNSNSKTLSSNSVGAENAPHIDSVDKSKHWGYSCSPPGKKFYLNCLEFMDCGSSDRTCISLPELLHPVDSISQIFVATFTSDILWFLSYCEIPSHIPVTIACHNTERCWSSSPDKRTSAPFPDFPNLIVVFPPFPETIAFGENHKKQGIACHHPKLFVLQREDSIRIIITSANLVAKQWNSVTNTIWWQDFPRRSAPDYLSLFIQAPIKEINIDSRSDFAAQLASFMASLVIDVPSQAHWILELTKYDFGGATGHLVASVPGIYSCRTPSASEFTYFKLANHCASLSFGIKFLGSVEASVVGLSHLFRAGVDSNGAQIKKLAAFLGRSCENAYGMLEVVLRRNTNVPADVNAVSILVSNPDEFSGGDCVQVGFLPRNIAKWVSPLWDIGFFGFSGFVSRDEVLAAALGGFNKKIQLILHGVHFPDISKMMRPEHVVALSYLIALIQRCRGLWRLQEGHGRFVFPFYCLISFVEGDSTADSTATDQQLQSECTAVGKRVLIAELGEEDALMVRHVHEAFDNSLTPYSFDEVDHAAGAHRLPQKWRSLKGLRPTSPSDASKVGSPFRVAFASRSSRSCTTRSAVMWNSCGFENWCGAAGGMPVCSMSCPSGVKGNGPEKSLRLHICNYELGIVFIFPPTETKGSSERNRTKLDDIVLPYVVPPPKYRPKDRPATAQAMKEAIAELNEQHRLKLAEIASIEEITEEIPDEEEEVEATGYIAEEKEEEKAYAEMLWSQVDSSPSC
ncbi:hypothetical protein EZV62_019739 [Acer yangbiense]|uniref:FHA domain-containing protein n=1 Tax=Acer yangbiense TaxID=1000413 RepID=A0A5C7HBK3_9ROSI|nr:hypothetical protein EZV62_019739 [Acer yangbiense]